MRLLLIRSKWDLPDMPLVDFAAQARAWGFDGCEIYLPALEEPPDEARDILSRAGLALVGQIVTEGDSADQHLRSFEQRFAHAVRYAPARINAHTGRDRFTPEENLTIFERAGELALSAGVPLTHETHRGRALFSTLSTLTLLRKIPALRLTADFSHWCCVHESLLADQQEALEAAIERTDYIHARVGHAEGPQVSDPMAPEWSAELEAHMNWWEAITHRRMRQGASSLAICPEFGPDPYMPRLPYTRQPVADLSSVVLAMTDLLRRRLGATTLA
jgi:sugar phosphate isomerase/epimerase